MRLPNNNSTLWGAQLNACLRELERKIDNLGNEINNSKVYQQYEGSGFLDGSYELEIVGKTEGEIEKIIDSNGVYHLKDSLNINLLLKGKIVFSSQSIAPTYSNNNFSINFNLGEIGYIHFNNRGELEVITQDTTITDTTTDTNTNIATDYGFYPVYLYRDYTLNSNDDTNINNISVVYNKEKQYIYDARFILIGVFSKVVFKNKTEGGAEDQTNYQTDYRFIPRCNNANKGTIDLKNDTDKSLCSMNAKLFEIKDIDKTTGNVTPVLTNLSYYLYTNGINPSLTTNSLQKTFSFDEKYYGYYSSSENGNTTNNDIKYWLIKENTETVNENERLVNNYIVEKYDSIGNFSLIDGNYYGIYVSSIGDLIIERQINEKLNPYDNTTWTLQNSVNFRCGSLVFVGYFYQNTYLGNTVWNFNNSFDSGYSPSMYINSTLNDERYIYLPNTKFIGFDTKLFNIKIIKETIDNINYNVFSIFYDSDDNDDNNDNLKIFSNKNIIVNSESIKLLNKNIEIKTTNNFNISLGSGSLTINDSNTTIKLNENNDNGLSVDTNYGISLLSQDSSIIIKNKATNTGLSIEEHYINLSSKDEKKDLRAEYYFTSDLFYIDIDNKDSKEHHRVLSLELFNLTTSPEGEEIYNKETNLVLYNNYNFNVEGDYSISCNNIYGEQINFKPKLFILKSKTSDNSHISIYDDKNFTVQTIGGITEDQRKNLGSEFNLESVNKINFTGYGLGCIENVRMINGKGAINFGYTNKEDFKNYEASYVSNAIGLNDERIIDYAEIPIFYNNSSIENDIKNYSLSILEIDSTLNAILYIQAANMSNTGLITLCDTNFIDSNNIDYDEHSVSNEGKFYINKDLVDLEKLKILYFCGDNIKDNINSDSYKEIEIATFYIKYNKNNNWFDNPINCGTLKVYLRYYVYYNIIKIQYRIVTEVSDNDFKSNYTYKFIYFITSTASRSIISKNKLTPVDIL